jgi:hypothetical protein
VNGHGQKEGHITHAREHSSGRNEKKKKIDLTRVVVAVIVGFEVEAA